MDIYRRDLHLLRGFEGEHIAFDVASSRVIYLNEIAYRILGLGPVLTKNSIIESLKDAYTRDSLTDAIDELIKSSILSEFPPTVVSFEKVDPNTVACGGISFNVSHNCNMRCGYCFGGGGSYNGPAVNMPLSVLRAGIDYFFKNRENTKNGCINFFGGEPFLNWEVMREGIKYAQKMADDKDVAVTFTITTNGTLITNPMLEFLNKFDVKLVFSLDGPIDIHDRERKFRDGTGTYNAVEKNILSTLKYPNIAVQIRPTITSHSCGRIDEIFAHFRKLGVDRVHMAPECAYGSRPGLSQEEYGLFEEGLENLTKNMLDALDRHEYWGALNILKFLNMIYCGILHRYYCGAGVSVVSVSPDGSIYPCPRFTGIESFLLGNIFSGIKKEKQKVFFDNDVQSRSDCSDCWARYVCGGGCSYMHWKTDPTLKRNDSNWCDWTRKCIELAIQAYAKLQEKGQDRIKEYFARYMPFLDDFPDSLYISKVISNRER